MRKVESKVGSGVCAAWGCKRKLRKKDGAFCPKHTHRWRKKNDPVAYTYHGLKSNAVRREKDFDLTLDEFRDFCKRTKYMDTKGKKSYSSSIDRIDHTKGYSIDNIHILTLKQNGYKGSQEKTPF